jgi:hypothetical protein
MGYVNMTNSAVATGAATSVYLSLTWTSAGTWSAAWKSHWLLQQAGCERFVRIDSAAQAPSSPRATPRPSLLTYSVFVRACPDLNEGKILNMSAIDARSQFRLNGMDLNPTDTPAPPHWMLSQPALRNWVGDLQKEFQRLVAAGFQPFDGDPVSPEAVIDALGLWDHPRPRGLLGHLAFTVRMLAATTREGLRIERELLWLRLR